MAMNARFLTFCFLSIVYAATAAPGDEKWGYVEVRPGAHMFYWLMYCRHAAFPETRPLVIWLTGGPGAGSSGWGNFEEVGPQDWRLEDRNITWLDHSHLLFIDAPVGAGYSYVQSDDLYVKTDTEAALDLVTLITQFFTVTPELITAPIFILGESYSGKVAPEFALELHKAVAAGSLQANLQGVIIRDGWVSSVDGMLSYPQYLLLNGLVDRDGYTSVDALARECELAIVEERWEDAADLFDITWLEMERVTYGVDFFYILNPLPPRYTTSLRATREMQCRNSNANSHLLDLETLIALMNGPIREKLLQRLPGIAVWAEQMNNVLPNLWGDYMKPVIHIVEELLNSTNVHVAVVNGQQDLAVNTEGVMQWVHKLRWPGVDDWNAAPRLPLVIDDVTEGYIKENTHFSMRWVNRAGHSVFYFNPKTGYNMMQELSGIL